MGLRTGKQPEVGDSFLWRICHAIDEPPRLLARNIGVPFKELEPLLHHMAGMLVEMDRDEVWWKIDEYVSRKLGMILAIKYEMNKALQRDRKKRVQRQERFRKFHDK